MSQAQNLLKRYNNIMEDGDDAGGKKTAKITGVKDAEFAKTHNIEVGQSYDLATDGDTGATVLMTPDGDKVSLDDIGSAYDFTVEEDTMKENRSRRRRKNEDVDPADIDAIAKALEGAGATNLVVDDNGGMNFLYNRRQYSLTSM